jgi:hypothetical protein
MVDKTIVINRNDRTTKFDVYVGSPMKKDPDYHEQLAWGKDGKWGSLYKYGDIYSILWKHLVKQLLIDSVRLRDIPELQGKVLGCWCISRGDNRCHGNSLAYLADHPETLNAAISGFRTPEEIAKEIFEHYGWVIPKNR